MSIDKWIQENSEIVGDLNCGEEMIPIDRFMSIVRSSFVAGAMSCGDTEDKAEIKAAIYMSKGAEPFIYGKYGGNKC